MSEGIVALELLDATILGLKPGDMIVLKVKRALTAEARQRMREQWQRLVVGSCAENVAVAILDEGTDIAILRREAA